MVGLIALGAQGETIDMTQFLYRAPVTFPGYKLDTALSSALARGISPAA